MEIKQISQSQNFVLTERSSNDFLFNKNNNTDNTRNIAIIKTIIFHRPPCSSTFYIKSIILKYYFVNNLKIIVTKIKCLNQEIKKYPGQGSNLQPTA